MAAVNVGLPRRQFVLTIRRPEEEPVLDANFESRVSFERNRVAEGCLGQELTSKPQVYTVTIPSGTDRAR